MPIMEAPISAIGCAMKTPCKSKKCGMMRRNGINRISWRHAFRNMECHGLPVPWKKFPAIIPSGMNTKPSENRRIAQAATSCK